MGLKHQLQTTDSILPQIFSVYFVVCLKKIELESWSEDKLLIYALSMALNAC